MHLLVECIPELRGHEQGLQEAVQVAGHCLVDQTNITFKADTRQMNLCGKVVATMPFTTMHV